VAPATKHTVCRYGRVTPGTTAVNATAERSGEDLCIAPSLRGLRGGVCIARRRWHTHCHMVVSTLAAVAQPTREGQKRVVPRGCAGEVGDEERQRHNTLHSSHHRTHAEPPSAHAWRPLHVQVPPMRRVSDGGVGPRSAHRRNVRCCRPNRYTLAGSRSSPSWNPCIRRCALNLPVLHLTEQPAEAAHTQYSTSPQLLAHASLPARAPHPPIPTPPCLHPWTDGGWAPSNASAGAAGGCANRLLRAEPDGCVHRQPPPALYRCSASRSDWTWGSPPLCEMNLSSTAACSTLPCTRAAHGFSSIAALLSTPCKPHLGFGQRGARRAVHGCGVGPGPCVWLIRHGPMNVHTAAPAAAARLAALPRDALAVGKWLVEDVGLLSLLYALIVLLALVSLTVALVLQPALGALRNFNRWVSLHSEESAHR
jgi:hypothetical protein